MKTILIILFLIVSPVYTYKEGLSQSNTIEFKLDEKVVVEELSIEDSVRLVLSNKNLSPIIIELLVAQSKHESGNYKNSLTRKHNNIFSRHYHKSDTFAIGAGGEAEGHNKFAIYPSVEYATLSQYYYLQRMKYSFNWKTGKEFAIELKNKRYYTDDTYKYARALNKHLENSKLK